MDLNYLLARHQVSLAAGRTTPCPNARHAHGQFAQAYAERIHALQTQLGATARPVVAA